MNEFTETVIRIITAIPAGCVATYGQIAALAGNRRAARQVARVLSSMSTKHKLPWYRVVNRHGAIALPPGHGGEVQRALLESEGVEFDKNGKIDLNRFGITEILDYS